VFGPPARLVVLEALMLSYDKVPFTCSYVPNENMKALRPLYLLMFLIGATWFARLESAALIAQTPAWLLTVLAGVAASPCVLGLTAGGWPPSISTRPGLPQKLGPPHMNARHSPVYAAPWPSVTRLALRLNQEPAGDAS
jgi:hypothetical protein